MAYGRIGVIGAMDSELAALIAALTQPAQETVQGLVFRTGRLGAREVVLVRCGIGKVSAARCTQVLIDRCGHQHRHRRRAGKRPRRRRHRGG